MRLADALRRRGIDADLALTERRGHAVELGRQAAEGGSYEAAVAVGGDGTLREVAEGLAGRLPVALCPSGTANVVARELGIPFSIEGSARLVQQGVVARVDSAICNDKRVLFVVGAGIDAEILNELEKSRSGGISYFSYAAPLARVFRRYRPAALRVTIDEKQTFECTFAIVSNSRYYAGPWVRFRRGPRMDDGVFETYLFHCPSAASLAMASARGLLGMIPGGRVSMQPARRVAIHSAAPTALQIDGDTAGTTPAILDVAPRSLPILVARDSVLLQ